MDGFDNFGFLTVPGSRLNEESSLQGLVVYQVNQDWLVHLPDVKTRDVIKVASTWLDFNINLIVICQGCVALMTTADMIDYDDTIWNLPPGERWVDREVVREAVVWSRPVNVASRH